MSFYLNSRRGDAALPGNEDVMDDIATAIAQRKAAESGGVFLPCGGKMYPVASADIDMLMRNGSVRRCDTMLMLEAALRAPEVRAIFVPRRALMADRDIHRICQRNGVAKTIFREADTA